MSIGNVGDKLLKCLRDCSPPRIVIPTQKSLSHAVPERGPVRPSETRLFIHRLAPPLNAVMEVASAPAMTSARSTEARDAPPCA